MAMPAIASAANSVVLNGIVNIEYTAIKIDQRTGPGGGLDANDRYQKSIGDPAIFSRYGLLIREELGVILPRLPKSNTVLFRVRVLWISRVSSGWV